MRGQGFWVSCLSPLSTAFIISLSLPLLAVAAPAQTATTSSCISTAICGPSVVALSNGSDDLGDTAERSAHDKLKGTHAVAVAIARPDRNRQFFHKNKLEFSFEMGYLPQNIPFPFDFLLGSGYNMTPLKYTLMPMLASLRWQTNDVGGPWIFRGNWEVSFTACITPFPRGPETHYAGYAMGIRRNLVQPNWRVTPFVEFRAGMGGEDAKQPKGVVWAQGQDFAFTLMMDSGLRYRINPKYAIWAGVQWMHISNLYMSEPRYLNYGINVYGPMIGLDIALRRHPRGQVQ